MAAAPLSEATKRARLAELRDRLGPFALPLSPDFANGSEDTVLCRYLAARAFDVAKAAEARAQASAAAALPPPRLSLAFRFELLSLELSLCPPQLWRALTRGPRCCKRLWPGGGSWACPES